MGSNVVDCNAAADLAETASQDGTVEGMKLKVRSDGSDVGSSPAEVVEQIMQSDIVGVDDPGVLKRKRLEDDETDSQAAEGSSRLEAVQETKESTEKPDRNPRYKKRKIAMFVSYSGCGYQGMQRNKGAKTIEGDLEEALFKAGAIAESTYGDPRKIDWARAARTDKGVSAIGQVVSGRFFIDPPGFVERVNSRLPEQIRVLGYTRVTGAFNAKNLCDRRRYEYVLPVFAFDPVSHRNEASNKGLLQQKISASDDQQVEESSSKLAEASKQVEAEGEPSEAKQGSSDKSPPVCTCEISDSGYVFGDEEREKLNRILQNFVGTHNFHNFTCRIKPEDPSTQRYMISFQASDVVTIQGSKFVRCTVVGQSFMLHQIRKMIGLSVAVMRGCAEESIFESAFRRDLKIAIPMAPELGLFLDECVYSAYNQRYSGTHDEISLQKFDEEIAKFKDEVIYPHIASTEAKDRVFAQWLHSLTHERYPDFASKTIA